MRRLLFLLFCLLSAVPVQAAWLESGAPAPTPRSVWTPWPTPWPTPVETPIQRHWIRPPQDDGAREIRSLLASASLGTPYGWGGLTIVPVIATQASASGVASLDDAIRSGAAFVSEVGSGGVVPTIFVDNRGSRPIFLMAGEIVLGGKQDRVISQDVIVGPWSSASVPVYCVEQGRWGAHREFSSAPYAADAGLRARAAAGASQQEIWSDVAAKSSSAGVRSETSAYDDYIRSPEVARRLDEYVAHCRIPWRGRTIGAIFLSGGQVLGADIFGDSALLSEMWPKLVRSYGAQAMARNRWDDRGWIGSAQALLQSLQSAWPSDSGSAGHGRRFSLGSSAWAVTYQSRVVHIFSLQSHTWVPRPPPDHPWDPFER